MASRAHAPADRHDTSRATPTRLRVQERILYGAGRTTREKIVRCPRDERTVRLADCLGCPRCDGVALSSTGERTGVQCRLEPNEQPQRPKFARIRSSQLGSVRVGELLTEPVRCVQQQSTMRQAELVWRDVPKAMVCVVDLAGRLVGLLTPGERGREGRVAEHVDTRVAAFIPEEAPALQAAAVMAYEQVHQLAVVDMERRPVGVLRADQLLSWVAAEAGYLMVR